MELKIESTAFTESGFIPSKYTCDGKNISPPLNWNNIPDNTKSITLISDDPDAPSGDWVHWVIYNIPPSSKELKEDTPHDKKLPDGSLQGINDFRKIGYGGPCPPSGVHRYYFKFYFLDDKLDLEPGASKKQLLDAMKGHIISESKIMAKYKRK